MNRVICICLLLVFLGTCCWADNSAQSPSDGRVAHMRQEYNRQAQAVDGWTSKANQQIALSVIIGLLGLCVGALQGTTRAWARILTVSVGLLVSGLTLFTKTVYPADSGSLQRAGLRARSLLNELQQILDNFDTSAPKEDQLQIQAEFYKKSSQIDQIAQDLFGSYAGPTAQGGTTQQTRSFFTLTTVYAQSKASTPAWITSGSQADSYSNYYVGVGNGRSLDEAKEASLADAVKKAAAVLIPQKNQSAAIPEKLLAIVKNSSETTDTWFTYDRPAGQYRYYTRLRVTNRLRSLDFGQLYQGR